MYAYDLSSFSQTQNAYWQNQKELPAYYGALDAGQSPMLRGYLLTEDDKVRRETIMRLMCDLALGYDDMSHRLGIRFFEYLARELESLADLEADGLLHRQSTGIEVTTQ